jgi:hypothetical protein
MRPCHVTGYFIPFKGKSHSLTSQAARLFYFAKAREKIAFAKEYKNKIGMIWPLP